MCGGLGGIHLCFMQCRPVSVHAWRRAIRYTYPYTRPPKPSPPPLNLSTSRPLNLCCRHQAKKELAPRQWSDLVEVERTYEAKLQTSLRTHLRVNMAVEEVCTVRPKPNLVVVVYPPSPFPPAPLFFFPCFFWGGGRGGSFPLAAFK